MGCSAIKTSEEKPISITSNINKEVPKLVINTPPEPINTSNKENINKNISFSCDTPVLPPVVPTPQFNKEISFHNTNTQKPIIPLLHSNSIQSEMNQTTISFNTNINPLQTINNISNSLQCTFIDDSSILELKVFASKYEAMYPIWIDKDKEITIEINGEWSVDDTKWPNEQSNEENFQNGELIGRVLDDSEYFSFKENNITPKSSGPLFLKMNLNSINSKIDGVITLRLTNVKKIELDSIERMIGWPEDINDIIIVNDKYKDEYEIPKLDREIFELINKMRYSSVLFAKQYLNGIKSLTKTTSEIYSSMTEHKETLLKFRYNSDIANDIIKYFTFIIGKNNTAKNKMSTVLNSIKEIEKTLNENYHSNRIKVYMKKHTEEKSLSTSIRCLLDEEIRNNIFNSEYNELTILTLKATKNKNVIDINIVVFSKGEDDMLSQRMKKQTLNTMKLNTIPNALESIEETNPNIKKHNSATNLNTIAKIDDDISHNDYFNNSQIISHRNTIDDVN